MSVEKSYLQDPDMQGVPAALARAAKRAKELARQAQTEYVVMRDGKLVREIRYCFNLDGAAEPAITKNLLRHEN